MQPVSVRVFLWVVFVVSCAAAIHAVLVNTNNATTIIAILSFIVNLRKFDLRSGRADQGIGWSTTLI